MKKGWGFAWGEDDVEVASAVAGHFPDGKGWVRANCPLCILVVGKADRKASLGHNVRSLRYKCFRCGSSGKFPEPIPEYAEFVDDGAAEVELGIEPPENFMLLDLPEAREQFVMQQAYEYLYGRGIDDGMIEDFCIGACWGGPFSGRVVLPLLGADNSWLWFSARSWFKKSDFPYKYPKGQRGGVLYNHAALFAASDKPILVVEGVFDAIALAPYGVAVWGKPTDENMWAFEAARRPVVFVLDGDAHEEAWARAQWLRLRGVQAGSVKLPPKVDPDELPRQLIFDTALRSLETGEAPILRRRARSLSPGVRTTP